jgi:hypothetical protein
MTLKAWILLGAAFFMSTAHAAAADLQAQLLEAIRARDVAAVQVALDAGADPNAPAEFARTPLHLAVRESTKATELLLSRGANPNVSDGDGRTPLHLANGDSAALLLKHKANFLAADRQGNSALHTAAESDVAMCRLLIEAGLPTDVRNNAGLSPLHFAALEGNRNTAEYLLSKGADVNARTLAPYQYKWTYIAWDVHGMEYPVPAGSTPLSIAKEQHRRSKWNTSRYRELADFFVSKGAIAERRAPAILQGLSILSPVVFVGFFWTLFHFDAKLRGWDDLAARYLARGPVPGTLITGQDGAVGRVGLVQTRRMLRAAATSDGLYLAMPSWVLAAHPPLLIPWSKLRVTSCGSGLGGQPRVELEAATSAPSRRLIILRGGVASAVLEKLPSASGSACN